MKATTGLAILQEETVQQQTIEWDFCLFTLQSLLQLRDVQGQVNSV